MNTLSQKMKEEFVFQTVDRFLVYIYVTLTCDSKIISLFETFVIIYTP